MGVLTFPQERRLSSHLLAWQRRQFDRRLHGQERRARRVAYGRLREDLDFKAQMEDHGSVDFDLLTYTSMPYEHKAWDGVSKLKYIEHKDGRLVRTRKGWVSDWEEWPYVPEDYRRRERRKWAGEVYWKRDKSGH